jgi:hypothetical protein
MYRNEGIINTYKISGSKHEGKISLGSSALRWEENIKNAISRCVLN